MNVAEDRQIQTFLFEYNYVGRSWTPSRQPTPVIALKAPAEQPAQSGAPSDAEAAAKPH